MEPITRWFVQNKVAANMMMIFIIIAGFVTIPYIKMEVFPAIEVDVINVSIVYPGASPSCLLYTSPSPRDRTRSRMPSSA